MATIQKREGKAGTSYRVLVRLWGQRPVSASFKRRTDAKKWAQDTESAMAGRALLPLP
jgi:hypothetical protein